MMVELRVGAELLTPELLTPDSSCILYKKPCKKFADTKYLCNFATVIDIKQRK